MSGYAVSLQCMPPWIIGDRRICRRYTSGKAELLTPGCGGFGMSAFGAKKTSFQSSLQSSIL